MQSHLDEKCRFSFDFYNTSRGSRGSRSGRRQAADLGDGGIGGKSSNERDKIIKVDLRQVNKVIYLCSVFIVDSVIFFIANLKK